jgi:trans-2,3-dihydro-3-hydroxyanthranilate isomerase
MRGNELRYRFFICDVFTTTRFGGNPLAVLPEAQGLDASQMQNIAREFNFSETTFVLPSADRHSRRLRIFTPTMEVPFAGHPNIGTAFALANDGLFGDIGDGVNVTFEEAAGVVPITIRRTDAGHIWCELAAPQLLSVGETVDPARIAEILCIGRSDVETSTHVPQVASVGLPFVVVELASRDALQRARINIARLEALRDAGIPPDICIYVRSGDEYDIRARMFSPLDNVPEDPATGSANCAVVALLTQLGVAHASGGPWRIAQGVEMGRPSYLEVRARREKDSVRSWLGGACAFFAEGAIVID